MKRLWKLFIERLSPSLAIPTTYADAAVFQPWDTTTTVKPFSKRVSRGISIDLFHTKVTFAPYTDPYGANYSCTVYSNDKQWTVIQPTTFYLTEKFQVIFKDEIGNEELYKFE